MTSPLTFMGKPTFFKELCYIYPPTINDILENPNFSIYEQILTTTQEDIWDMYAEKSDPHDVKKPPTPFELLLIYYYNNEDYKEQIEKAFKFFTKETVRIMPEQKIILFSSDIENAKQVEDLRLLTEETYFDFQNAIRSAMGNKPVAAPDMNEDPRTTRLKAKARLRDRIKKKINSKKGVSLTTTMAALCCMGIGINPLNIGTIPYASLHLLIGMGQKKDKYLADIQYLAAGADAKKVKIEYWMTDQD